MLPSTEPTELEHELCLDVEQESADFENYVRCDDNVPCYGQLSDQEIINEICQELISDNSSDEENEDVNNPPSSKEVLNSINILRNFFLPKNLYSQELDNMENYIIENCYKQQIQTLMTDFFKY